MSGDVSMGVIGMMYMLVASWCDAVAHAGSVAVIEVVCCSVAALGVGASWCAVGSSVSYLKWYTCMSLRGFWCKYCFFSSVALSELCAFFVNLFASLCNIIHLCFLYKDNHELHRSPHKTERETIWPCMRL